VRPIPSLTRSITTSLKRTFAQIRSRSVLAMLQCPGMHGFEGSVWTNVSSRHSSPVPENLRSRDFFGRSSCRRLSAKALSINLVCGYSSEPYVQYLRADDKGSRRERFEDENV